jgi:hypothetical protein
MTSGSDRRLNNVVTTLKDAITAATRPESFTALFGWGKVDAGGKVDHSAVMERIRNHFAGVLFEEVPLKAGSVNTFEETLFMVDHGAFKVCVFFDTYTYGNGEEKKYHKEERTRVNFRLAPHPVAICKELQEKNIREAKEAKEREDELEEKCNMPITTLYQMACRTRFNEYRDRLHRDRETEAKGSKLVFEIAALRAELLHHTATPATVTIASQPRQLSVVTKILARLEKAMKGADVGCVVGWGEEKAATMVDHSAVMKDISSGRFAGVLFQEISDVSLEAGEITNEEAILMLKQCAFKVCVFFETYTYKDGQGYHKSERSRVRFRLVPHSPVFRTGEPRFSSEPGYETGEDEGDEGRPTKRAKVSAEAASPRPSLMMIEPTKVYRLLPSAQHFHTPDARAPHRPHHTPPRPPPHTGSHHRVSGRIAQRDRDQGEDFIKPAAATHPL